MGQSHGFSLKWGNTEEYEIRQLYVLFMGGSQIPRGLPKFIHPSIHSVVRECLLCAGSHTECQDAVMAKLDMVGTLMEPGRHVTQVAKSCPGGSPSPGSVASHRVVQTELATALCKRLSQVPCEFLSCYEYGPVDRTSHPIRTTLSFTIFRTPVMCLRLLRK